MSKIEGGSLDDLDRVVSNEKYREPVKQDRGPSTDESYREPRPPVNPSEKKGGKKG